MGYHYDNNAAEIWFFMLDAVAHWTTVPRVFTSGSAPHICPEGQFCGGANFPLTHFAKDPPLHIFSPWRQPPGNGWLDSANRLLRLIASCPFWFLIEDRVSSELLNRWLVSRICRRGSKAGASRLSTDRMGNKTSSATFLVPT